MNSSVYILPILMFLSSAAFASEGFDYSFDGEETYESQYADEEGFYSDTNEEIYDVDYNASDYSEEAPYEDEDNGSFDSEALKIGSDFKRGFLKPGDHESLDQNLKRAALSAAEYGSGSAFYVGQFNGKHIMATNAHVVTAFASEDWTAERYNQNPVEACKIFPGDPYSEVNYVRFSLIGREYDCKKFIGLWPEIDFALFEIEVLDGFKFEQMGISLKNKIDHFKGQELAMFSYGVYENPGMFEFDLAHTQDQICKVFSDETRDLSDDKDLSAVAIWSFASGCDISVGDSGSAMIDASTGLFTGIIWAGAADKSGAVSDDKYLLSVLASEIEDEEMVWTQMNYAVPAAKITEIIMSSLETVPDESRQTLESMFN